MGAAGNYHWWPNSSVAWGQSLARYNSTSTAWEFSQDLGNLRTNVGFRAFFASNPYVPVFLAVKIKIKTTQTLSQTYSAKNERFLLFNSIFGHYFFSSSSCVMTATS